MRRIALVIYAIRACGRFAVFAVLPVIFLFGGSVTCQTVPLSPSESDADRHLDHVVPFVPTPLEVAQKMLEIAKVQPDDVVYDLGSGDGRIVILAAQKFGARAVGVELDSGLYEESSARIRKLGLQDRVQILHENMFEVNVRHATVVTLYLLTVVNEHLRPILERQLRSGARVVSHDFQVPGWQPVQTVEVMSKNGVPSKIFLYIRP
ncbi:MAG: SAM-dependent methyltransferase [Terriglobia bacterium]